MPSRVLRRCISDSHFYSFGWLLFHIFAFELSYPALWVGLGWSNSMQYVGWLDYLLLYLFSIFVPFVYVFRFFTAHVCGILSFMIWFHCSLLFVRWLP